MRRVAAAAIALAAMAAAPAVEAGTGVSAPTEHGAGDGVWLPAPPEPGQRATLDTSISHVTDAGTIQLMVRLSSEVMSVEGNGSYTTRSTIESLNHSAPPGADLGAFALDNLPTVTFEQSFDDRGAPIPEAAAVTGPGGLSAEQLVGGQQLLDTVAMLNVGFPEEPVTVGMAWRSPGQVASHGVVVDVTYQCRLVELGETAYTLDVSYAESFGATAPADRVVEGTVSGTATLTGSRDNPLVVSGTMWQTVDGIETNGGTSSEVHSDVTIRVTATEG